MGSELTGDNLILDVYCIAHLDHVRRNRDLLPIDQNVTMNHHLACLSTSLAETQQINDIIQTGFQHFQHDRTGYTTAAGCRLVNITKLFLEQSVEVAHFLFFHETLRILTTLATHLGTMYAGRVLSALEIF